LELISETAVKFIESSQSSKKNGYLLEYVRADYIANFSTDTMFKIGR